MQCTFASTARARVSCQQCFWHFDRHWRWTGIQCWGESGSLSQCAWFTGLRTGDKEADRLGKQWMGRSRRNWGLAVPARFTDVCSLNSSLKKQPSLSPRNDVWGTTAEIPYWWPVTTQISGSASNWSCRDGTLLQPIRSTTQIWALQVISMRISAVVPQTSFREETGCRVVNCRPFSQDMNSHSSHYFRLSV